jgi:glycosyltransferase involved in cell wall biosynthesis
MVEEQKLRILLVNTLDQEGGAEQVAWSLHEGYRARGHASWFAVGAKRRSDNAVLLMDNTRTHNPWSRFWWGIQKNATSSPGKFDRWREKLRRGLALVAEPQGIVETLQGYEHSHFPSTYSLLDLPPQRPDILHCHSLQRGYFELEALPLLSQQVPTVLTMHDAWLLSGHCTHPFDCERWRTGCGQCPDLSISPAILRDGSARNWQRKRDIFKQSRLWIATDSYWLLDKVKASMLTYVDARTIYPGVDLETFCVGDREAARSELGLPQDANILLFVAAKARNNPWKNYPQLKRVFERVKQSLPDKVILLIVGDPISDALVAEADDVWLAPPMIDRHLLAKYYRAADLYVHAAHVETFGLTIVEAMASGIPVVATRTAAIPELVANEESGYLTTPGEVEEMATRIVELLQNAEQRQAMGQRAAYASKKFDTKNTVDAYLNLYYEILERDFGAGND